MLSMFVQPHPNNRQLSLSKGRFRQLCMSTVHHEKQDKHKRVSRRNTSSGFWYSCTLTACIVLARNTGVLECFPTECGFRGRAGGRARGIVRARRHRNSIAFGSAPRREADSQPISQLDRPAVSQTETYTLGFLSVADTGPSSGETNWSQDWQWPTGNAGGRRLFGRRFEPRCDQYGDGAAAGVRRPGFEPPT